MTARPPRAATKGDAKRAKPRGATQGERAERGELRRSPSVIPTDRFERITDDEVVEVTELPTVPRMRTAVLELGPHLAAAQSALAAAGHDVVAAASGRDGIERLRPALGELDVLLVGLPGGEPLIDAALALEVRPVVIAASTSSAVEAVRRAAAAGADLATARPHDVERLAPTLLAAARMIEQRRQLLDASSTAADLFAEREPGGMLPFDVFQRAVELELARARRYAYPLAVAILRARAGNALVNAIRDVDLVTELEHDRFLVLLPYTDRLAGAEVARRIISAVAAGDPVIAGGRTFQPRLVGAVAGSRPEAPASFEQLVHDASQLLEQAAVTGASLAVEP